MDFTVCLPIFTVENLLPSNSRSPALKVPINKRPLSLSKAEIAPVFSSGHEYFLNSCPSKTNKPCERVPIKSLSAQVASEIASDNSVKLL